VTLKGQVGDPKIFGAHDLENGWRYRLGYNRTPIGNGTWVSNGYMTDDVGEVLIVTWVCLGVRYCSVAESQQV